MKQLLFASALVLASLSSFGCSEGGFVDAIVIENPTAFTANVDVGGDTREGWVGLATVQANSEATIRNVLDQGDSWTFRFGYSGYQQEIRLSREDLARGRWRVPIPSSFESELRRRGLVPPP